MKEWKYSQLRRENRINIIKIRSTKQNEFVLSLHFAYTKSNIRFLQISLTLKIPEHGQVSVWWVRRPRLFVDRSGFGLLSAFCILAIFLVPYFGASFFTLVIWSKARGDVSNLFRFNWEWDQSHLVTTLQKSRKIQTTTTTTKVLPERRKWQQISIKGAGDLKFLKWFQKEKSQAVDP